MICKPNKKENNFKILLLGIDGSGKTTVFFRVTISEHNPITPTIGFNKGKISFKQSHFILWDVSGTKTFNNTIQYEYKDINGWYYFFLKEK